MCGRGGPPSVSAPLTLTHPLRPSPAPPIFFFLVLFFSVRSPPCCRSAPQAGHTGSTKVYFSPPSVSLPTARPPTRGSSRPRPAAVNPSPPPHTQVRVGRRRAGGSGRRDAGRQPRAPPAPAARRPPGPHRGGVGAHDTVGGRGRPAPAGPPPPAPGGRSRAGPGRPLRRPWFVRFVAYEPWRCAVRRARPGGPLGPQGGTPGGRSSKERRRLRQCEGDRDHASHPGRGIPPPSVFHLEGPHPPLLRRSADCGMVGTVLYVTARYKYRCYIQ